MELSNERLIDIYRQMVLIRHFEERAASPTLRQDRRLLPTLTSARRRSRSGRSPRWSDKTTSSRTTATTATPSRAARPGRDDGRTLGRADRHQRRARRLDAPGRRLRSASGRLRDRRRPHPLASGLRHPRNTKRRTSSRGFFGDGRPTTATSTRR